MSTSARAANIFKIRKTPRSQALAPQGPRKGGEEHAHRHTVKAHVEEDRTGSRLTYAERESEEEKGEKARNGKRATGGRGIMESNGVGGKGERNI